MAYYQQSQAPPPYVPTAHVIPSGPSAFHVRDYLAWSIINICCGWGIMGLIPLVCSIICRNNKNVNNYSGAQSWSTLALIANIIVTIIGGLGWLGFIIGMVVIAVAASGSLPMPTTVWPPGN